MLRKVLLGVAAAATLGTAAMTSAPASAQAVTFSFGSPGYGYGYRPVQYGPRWGYGGGYYGRPYYGYGGGYYGRPYYGPRCFFRPVRYWDGWGWVVQQRRICR
ncbi:hypothetical protein [Bosea sp. (in: a-proteobacteria)]|jgi:hypothetical protein|uniref:hypothetical protein n=1 Tax=Bosea sp. (in: a-proteobacteria) TaxID=1871050 RepID=UPI003F70FC85